MFFEEGGGRKETYILFWDFLHLWGSFTARRSCSAGSPEVSSYPRIRAAVDCGNLDFFQTFPTLSSFMACEGPPQSSLFHRGYEESVISFQVRIHICLQSLFHAGVNSPDTANCMSETLKSDIYTKEKSPG